jgi:hypothetical protein
MVNGAVGPNVLLLDPKVGETTALLLPVPDGVEVLLSSVHQVEELPAVEGPLTVELLVLTGPAVDPDDRTVVSMVLVKDRVMTDVT